MFDLSQYYESWCFLLDKSYSSTLPTLISGLESILFAINIDNANLNIPSKITKSNTLNSNSSREETPIEINSSSLPENSILNTDSLIEIKPIKVKVKPLQNNNLNKLRKNNVIVFDIDEIETTELTNSNNEKAASSYTDDVFHSELTTDSPTDKSLNLKVETPIILENKVHIIEPVAIKKTKHAFETRSLNERVKHSFSVGEKSKSSSDIKSIESAKVAINDSPDTSCNSSNEKNFEVCK